MAVRHVIVPFCSGRLVERCQAAADSAADQLQRHKRGHGFFFFSIKSHEETKNTNAPNRNIYYCKTIIMHTHLGKCASKWESPCCQVSDRQQTSRPANIHSFIQD
jgi:hypothetical protein